MEKMIEIKLGEYRPAVFCDSHQVECRRNDRVILEGERGAEFGTVVAPAKAPGPLKTPGVEGKVLRVATDSDLKQIENNRLKAREAINICMRKIDERKLDMRLVKAEYSFDASKIIFYFTAEGRVDFRNLVQDLARVFRVRIELKQIGVRDKAKIIGGLGVCGRALCCSSYMRMFHPSTMKMSKEQGLPLNPSKISGVCDRIKCCMAYEYAVYKEFARSLPRMGEKITIPDGKGKVIDINILRRVVTVDLGEGRIVRTVFEQSHEN